MPQVELLQPNRLNIGGTIYLKGVKTPVDMGTALDFDGNPRFKVTGLDTRAAVEHRERLGRPEGAGLLKAIREAADDLDVDDDTSFDRLGKPALAALAERLGYQVTKEERDRALASVEKAPQAGHGLEAAEVKAARTLRVSRAAVAPVETAHEEKVTL